MDNQKDQSTVKTEIKTVKARDLRPGWKFRKTKRHKWVQISSVANVKGMNRESDGTESTMLKTIVNRCIVLNQYEGVETKLTYKN